MAIQRFCSGFKTTNDFSDFSVAGINLVDKGTTWKKWSLVFLDNATIKINGKQLKGRKGLILSYEYDYEVKTLEFVEDGKEYYFWAGF